jgi:hypothetical protein
VYYRCRSAGDRRLIACRPVCQKERRRCGVVIGRRGALPVRTVDLRRMPHGLRACLPVRCRLRRSIKSTAAIDPVGAGLDQVRNPASIAVEHGRSDGPKGLPAPGVRPTVRHGVTDAHVAEGRRNAPGCADALYRGRGVGAHDHWLPAYGESQPGPML